MSLRGVGIRMLTDGFPRVSGDEPLTRALVAAVRWFSPRERG